MLDDGQLAGRGIDADAVELPAEDDRRTRR
jgi:hypothetical protein